MQVTICVKWMINMAGRLKQTLPIHSQGRSKKTVELKNVIIDIEKSVEFYWPYLEIAAWA